MIIYKMRVCVQSIGGGSHQVMMAEKQKFSFIYYDFPFT